MGKLRLKFAKPKQWIQKNKVKNEKSLNLQLNGYNVYKLLGQGTYGKVRIVQQKKTKKLYAMKYADKRHESGLIKAIIEERNILAKLRYPFICNLKFAFQSQDFICLILDLSSACDLRQQMGKFNFSELVIKSWISQLACAVEYLHSRGIVHRDIKPDNILLNVEGTIRLADFNVSREIPLDSPTMTGVIGTFNYMAPEMHYDVPYTRKIDWWAIGIVFYELTYRFHPFKVKNRHHILSRILDPGLILPNEREGGMVSEEWKEGIEKLLTINPRERLGSTFELFNLEFFSGLSRIKLEEAAASIHERCRKYRIFRTSPTTMSETVFKKVNLGNPVSQEIMKKEYPIWVEARKRKTEEKRRRFIERQRYREARRSLSHVVPTNNSPVEENSNQSNNLCTHSQNHEPNYVCLEEDIDQEKPATPEVNVKEFTMNAEVRLFQLLYPEYPNSFHEDGGPPLRHGVTSTVKRVKQNEHATLVQQKQPPIVKSFEMQVICEPNLDRPQRKKTQRFIELVRNIRSKGKKMLSFEKEFYKPEQHELVSETVVNDNKISKQLFSNFLDFDYTNRTDIFESYRLIGLYQDENSMETLTCINRDDVDLGKK